MLTDEQAKKLLTTKLGITEWKSKLESSSFDFLFELDKRFKQVMYYENISWGSKRLEELKPPSVEEVIHQIVDLGGGACFQLNYAMYLLLKYLGYDAFPIGTQTAAADLPNNHILIIVRFPRSPMTSESCSCNLNISEFGSHDYYLVDVGWVQPSPGPVYLNKLPYIYNVGGFQIEFKYNREINKFEIFFHGGDPLKGPYEDKASQKYSEFVLTPLGFADFEDTMTQVFTNPDVSYFLKTASLSRYYSLEDARNNMFVNFMGRRLAIITPDKRSQTKFETYIEMIPAIQKYFPNLKPETLQQALENYEERQREFKEGTNSNKT